MDRSHHHEHHITPATKAHEQHKENMHHAGHDKHAGHHTGVCEHCKRRIEGALKVKGIKMQTGTWIQKRSPLLMTFLKYQ
ncbi:MAG: hypothetical protein WKF91_16155 [Segetibacter sp.]